MGIERVTGEGSVPVVQYVSPDGMGLMLHTRYSPPLAPLYREVYSVRERGTTEDKTTEVKRRGRAGRSADADEIV